MNAQNTPRIDQLRDDLDTLAMMAQGLAIALNALEPLMEDISEMRTFADAWADRSLPSTAPIEDREQELTGKETRYALVSLRVVEDLYHHLLALCEGRDAQRALVRSQIESLVAAG